MRVPAREVRLECQALQVAGDVALPHGYEVRAIKQVQVGHDVLRPDVVVRARSRVRVNHQVDAAAAAEAAAQRAADTRDPDGDGRYCESLPCPRAGQTTNPKARPGPAAPTPSQRSCRLPTGVQPISFSGTKYPNIRRHFRGALRHGWPRTLVLNRHGADARRARLLEAFPTRDGFDRDEYPPAVGRGKGKGLERGRNPRGWKADVRYVPSGENRSHGSLLGIKLRRSCDGTRSRYVFY